MVVAGSAARGPKNRIGAFAGALEREVALRADALDAAFGTSQAPLRSLYFGGGTPSLLPSAAIERIFGIVRDRYGLATDAEVTIEANPGADERGDLPRLRDVG